MSDFRPENIAHTAMLEGIDEETGIIKVFALDVGKFDAISDYYMAYYSEHFTTPIKLFLTPKKKLPKILNGEEPKEYEVCHLIGTANGILNIRRGQEGTTAQEWEAEDMVAYIGSTGPVRS